jgi:hypothetical protein
MTRNLVLLLSIILATSNTFGQEEKKYSELTGEALKLYQSKDYRNAGLKYSAIFKDFSSYVQSTDRIYAACSWANTNEPDSAFKQLILLAQNENFHSFNDLKLH